MKNLAYHKINYIMPMYLEFAPYCISNKELNVKSKQDFEEQIN